MFSTGVPDMAMKLSLELADMPESGRLVILDRLRFVNDDEAEMLVLERLPYGAAKAAVGREHNVPSASARSRGASKQ